MLAIVFYGGAEEELLYLTGSGVAKLVVEDGVILSDVLKYVKLTDRKNLTELHAKSDSGDMDSE